MSLAATIGAVVVAALLLFALERRASLRAPRSRWLPELALNLAFSALAFGVSALLVRPAVLRALGWSARERFGLVQLVELPAPAQGVLAVLLLDLSFYYWHRLNHEVPFLWRLHNVHHCDPSLDVSTSFRFHFGEVALSTLFRVVQVTAVGASAAAYGVYELAFQLATVFHHSNVRVPIRLERWLNRLLVTPRMHGIHHSQVREETSSNYSVVFSGWDRLHRTLRLNVPQARIVIGVPGYAGREDNRFGELIAMPFRRQRDHWRDAAGRRIVRDPAELGPDRHRLEE